MNADNDCWQFYKHGLVMSGYCPDNSVDHDVTLVGYIEDGIGTWARQCYRMSFWQYYFEGCKGGYSLWWPDNDEKKKGLRTDYCC